MLYHTDQKNRGKRRRSDSGDDMHLAVDVSEPLYLHDGKRQRFSALRQDWKSQALLEPQMPQWLPTPPSMDVDMWPEAFPHQHSWQQNAADGHLHQCQPQQHYNDHMALRNSSGSTVGCHSSHRFIQNQSDSSQAAGTGASYSELVAFASQERYDGIPTTPSLSPHSDSHYCSNNRDVYEYEGGGCYDDEMDDCELDPSSEYYQINMLLNQLHRERALRQQGNQLNAQGR
ncbi:hypothetical protein LPJ64_002862 [Coemansia asiatica]|uniref:Uncharacterized protein n=1 Tax=Coemansia asiatica TaxID=1052880 RepID=A0A9W8CJB0_9FUNG|nr:hypothetical protein LPJ64_002862 [Coemansia asiatica]